MKKKSTSYWVEGMSSVERKERIALLLSTLEKKLIGSNGSNDMGADRTFVFVPEPPTLVFDENTKDLDVRTLRWGMAGKAAVVETVKMAADLAPVMFDLWSDALFVMAFAAPAPDDQTLGRWIAHTVHLKAEDSIASNKQMMPKYALISFDWGDWVDQDS